MNLRSRDWALVGAAVGGLIALAMPIPTEGYMALILMPIGYCAGYALAALFLKKAAKRSAVRDPRSLWRDNVIPISINKEPIDWEREHWI